MAADEQEISVQFANEQPQENSLWQKVKQQVNPANHSLMENVLAGVTFILFCIVIALAASLGASGGGGGGGGGGDGSSSGGCETRMCLFRSATVVSLTNTTVDPCSDFYKYSCGMYPLLHPIDVEHLERTEFTELRAQNQKKIEQILATSIQRNSPNSYERKMKTFFTKCIDDFQTERLRGLPLAMLLMPNFYVLNASAAQTFDLNTMMEKSSAFGLRAFFDYFVIPNPNDGNKLTISIDAGGLGLRRHVYLFSMYQDELATYRLFLRNVSTLLAADMQIPANELSQRIDDFVNDVIEIETKLANLSFSTQQPEKPPLDPENLVTLNELDRIYQPIRWTQLFRFLFGNNVISGQTKVAVQLPDYMNKVMSYIRDQLPGLYPSDYKRKLSNYINWRIMQPFITDLSSQYLHAKRELDAARSDDPVEHLTRFDYCLNRLSIFMQKGLSALFVKDHFPDHSRKEVDTMFQNIRDDLVKAMDRVEIFDKEAKLTAQAKLRNLQDKIAYSPDEVTDQYLDNYYLPFEADSNSTAFTITIGWLTQFTRLTGQRLGSAPDKNLWEGATYDVTMHLNNPNLLITIPAGAMQWPLFSRHLPGYINYGTLGQLMATELMRAIDNAGHYYDEKGESRCWWRQDVMMNYASKVNCTFNYFKGMRAGPYNSGSIERFVDMKDILGSSNFRNLLATIEGLRLVNDAYKVRYGNEEKPLPLSHLTRDQTFFVTWAQNYCYNRDPTYSYVKGRLRKIIPEEILVNGGLSIVPEFSAAFNCPANSPMVMRSCPAVFFN